MNRIFAVVAVVSGMTCGTQISGVEIQIKELARLGTASASVDNNKLVVTTGLVRRTWQWTGKGLVTTSFIDVRSGKEWAVKPGRVSDWDLPGLTEKPVFIKSQNGGRYTNWDLFFTSDIFEKMKGEWIGTIAQVKDDDGFVNKYVEVISTIRYEAQHLEVQHVVWVFPGAPGLRTQLRVKALQGFDPNGLPEEEGTYTDCGATFPLPSTRSEYLPLDFSIPNERLYWGYYNNPGNRRDQSQDMLKEQVVKGWPVFLREDIDWASGMAVKYGNAGVIVVKESPKCVNQKAHNTGAFYTNKRGVAITGWGLTPKELVPDRFRECWANWTIVYQDGDDGLQLALKQFDAARYPVFPERDMFILMNTWGPANPFGSQFTEEEFVLKELPKLAEIGVDVMQIDDGWQKKGGGSGASDFLPKYKNGWTDIKSAADKAGMRLGLWVAIRNAKVEDLSYNLDKLGFITWKADFEHLANRDDYEQRITRLREVMKHAWMKTQFTLCPEYDDPRYGWYFAREYGTIYFENVQEGLPEHLTMVPFQVLRQHWLMAKYFPANKLQVMLQNPKRAGPHSDGPEHGHGYCFAMGLPFAPCFFQSAQNLDEPGRKELHDLISIFKTCRKDIFTSLTFPIGDLPDNESWSGFQMVSTSRNGGHLLLFRELHNNQPRHFLQLMFLAGKKIILENLVTGKKETLTVGSDGSLAFEINACADYRLLRYEIIK